MGWVTFENSQLSKVAPSASKSMVSRPSKPSATGNARARHSSIATHAQFQHRKSRKQRKKLTVAFLEKLSVGGDKILAIANLLRASKIHLDVAGCRSRVNTSRLFQLSSP